jgi:Calcineurin-like phosphoesterase
VPPCFTGDDYAWRMTRAALEEVRAAKPDLVLANGDLTDRGRPDEIRRALELLRGVGAPLLVTRGNHDRRFHTPDKACGEDGDCLRREAFPERAPGDHALTSVARVGRRVALVGLDSCDPESGTGTLKLGDQLAWLDRTLGELRAEGRIALVAFHHHIANQSNSHHPPPLFFGVSPANGGPEALQVIGKHEVPLVLHGHTHRNYLARDPLAPTTWFLENGATKEYPAGYALLHVHEDGIVRTFHRPTEAFAREWTRTSAGQVWGRQPDYTRGTLRSRSFVLRFEEVAAGDGSPAPSVIGPFGAPVSRRSMLAGAFRRR